MSDAKAKKAKRIFLLLRITVVVLGITWAVFWLSGVDENTGRQRWSNLVAIFRQMNVAVFALALGIFLVGQIVVGFRWWLLLRTQSIFIGFWAAVRLHLLGLFYNNFMPSSVGGDLLRAWYVTKHTDKRLEAVLSVFFDRAIGLLSTLVIAAFFYLLFLRGRGAIVTSPGEDQAGLFQALAEYRGLLVVVAALAAAALGALSLHHRGRAALKKASSFLWTCGLKMVHKFKDAVVIYCSKPLTIFAVFWLTVLMQLTTITGFWFLGENLGVQASIKYYYVFFTLTWVLGAVPVSIGGAVVVEVLLAGMFIRFAGVGQGPASALALSQRAVWMCASLPGAVIHLIGAHLPKDFSIDYEDSIG